LGRRKLSHWPPKILGPQKVKSFSAALSPWAAEVNEFSHEKYTRTCPVMRTTAHSHLGSRTPLPLAVATTTPGPGPTSSKPRRRRAPLSARSRRRRPPPSASSYHAPPRPPPLQLVGSSIGRRTLRLTAAPAGLLHPLSRRPLNPCPVQLGPRPALLSHLLCPTPAPPPSGRRLAPAPPPSSRRPIHDESRSSSTCCTRPPPRRCPFPSVSPPRHPLRDGNVICGNVISPRP
jgi:hypothetical protein